MDWKNWLILGAGYAAAPATGGASIPIATSVAGMRNAQQASDKTLAAQTQATDKANAMLQPYASMGGQALNTLGGLMGFAPVGGGASAAASGPTPEEQAAAGKLRTALDAHDFPYGEAQKRKLMEKIESQLEPRGLTLGTLAAQSQTQSSFGDAVRMRAPDGRVVIVPKSRMAEAQQQGGQVL